MARWLEASIYHVSIQNIYTVGSGLCQTNKGLLLFCLVPEIIEAFSTNDDQEFQKKYGFAKLDKSAGPNIVVACLGGKRAAAAAEQLQQIGFEGVRQEKYKHLWVQPYADFTFPF